MFRFEKEQKIFDIAGVKVGGQPGELPTVMVGSIFYKGHGIVKDPIKGVFDKGKAEKLIVNQDELSEETGNPCMVDVEAFSEGAIEKYIDFISEVTDAPILVNSIYIPVRLHGVKYAQEIGLMERVVYVSINYKVDSKEIEVLKNIELESAIIQTFNPKNPWPNGMLQILMEENGLLNVSSKIGIKKPLILTNVLDVPSIALAVSGIHLIKEKTGLPTGTAPIGVVSSWYKNAAIKIFGGVAKGCCESAAVTVCQFAGANFIHYGSLNKANKIFPAAAIVDAIVAYRSRLHGIKPKTKNHPLYKIPFHF